MPGANFQGAMCLDINNTKAKQYSVSQRGKVNFIKNGEKKFWEFC